MPPEDATGRAARANGGLAGRRLDLCRPAPLPTDATGAARAARPTAPLAGSRSRATRPGGGRARSIGPGVGDSDGLPAATAAPAGVPGALDRAGSAARRGRSREGEAQGSNGGDGRETIARRHRRPPLLLHPIPAPPHHQRPFDAAAAGSILAPAGGGALGASAFDQELAWHGGR
jgi:hypothetical protein